MKNFKVVCAENGWAFVASDPADDDPVPTKLKNNKLVELIYPLTNFLDVTPGYHEYDISGWFLLFFCIFFAMIFGDAGYGALICALAIGLMAKGAKNGKSFSSVNVLVFLLGFSTMCWGVLTCTWFGIDSAKLPKWMVDLSFAPISPAKVGSDVSNTNQQIFCFILAIVQLSIAHIKGILRYRKSLKCLGELGSLLELWGMYYVVMDMVVDAVKYPLGITEETLYFFGIGWLPIPYVALGVLFFGFALNFIFSNYDGSIKDSIFESLKNYQRAFRNCKCFQRHCFLYTLVGCCSCRCSYKQYNKYNGWTYAWQADYGWFWRYSFMLWSWTEYCAEPFVCYCSWCASEYT